MEIKSANFNVGYVFDLHILCGGYAYYSTYSRWHKWDNHGREFRRARPENLVSLREVLFRLGHQPQMLINEADYQSWLMHRGWAMMSVENARLFMPQWLKSRPCVNSPTGTYTDVSLCAPNALNHHASQGKRQAVMKRDGEQCLLCQKTPKEGASITMQHIKPFSQGGETTIRNLVALCEECNKALGSSEYRTLYKLAKLPYDYDIGLYRGEKMTGQSFRDVVRLSSNLMHTRCEVW